MKLTITLNQDEVERLNRAVDLSGLRSKAELMRFLIKNYLNDFYGEKQNDQGTNN